MKVSQDTPTRLAYLNIPTVQCEWWVEFCVNKIQTGDNDSEMRDVDDKLDRLDQGTGGRLP